MSLSIYVYNINTYILYKTIQYTDSCKVACKYINIFYLLFFNINNLNLTNWTTIILNNTNNVHQKYYRILW